MEITTQICVATEILAIFEKYSMTKIEGVALLEVLKYNILSGN